MAFQVINTQSYLTQEAQAKLRDGGCVVRYQPLEGLSEDKLIEQLADVDGVIAGSEDYTPRVLRACSRLRVISRTGAGVDHIDLEAATRFRVQVTNTPGATSDSVADLTVCLALCLIRRVPFLVSAMKDDRWETHCGRELGSMTFGVLGAGSIGKAVLRRVCAFGGRCLACDLLVDEKFARECGVEYLSQQELLSQSDILSLHVWLSDQTRNIINRQSLSLMKPTAYLINTARPALVDKEALVEWLRTGRLAGAAIDVHDPKPCAPGDPLVHLDNVIATPWMGYSTADAIEKMCRAATDDLIAVLHGRTPRFPVNQLIPTATR